MSSDPFTNPDSQHATQVEADTFSFRGMVVAAFQSGRFFDGGSSNIGWASSQNNDQTWKHGFLPSTTVNSTPPGPYARISDPSVAYDAKHGVWLIASLGLDASGIGKGVLVSRSKNGGRTWAAPVTVSTTTGFYDKTWIACDNTESSEYYGNCYYTWDEAASGDLLLSSTSTDGGKTWGAPKTTADNATGLGGQPLAGPFGNVVVPALSAFADQILAYTSNNGGKSWQSSVVVADISDHGIAGNLRSEPLPSADMDGEGKVYVVWHDCRFRAGCSSNDIVMSTSTTGRAWTSPVRIPIDAVSSTVDHFIPGIVVARGTYGAHAVMAVSYYFYPNADCTESTCELFVGTVMSVNGGASWGPVQTLAGPMKLTDLANTSQGYMVGDYLSTSFAGTSPLTVYARAKPKNGNVFDQAMWASKVKLHGAPDGPQRVIDEPVLSTKGDRVVERSRLRVMP